MKTKGEEMPGSEAGGRRERGAGVFGARGKRTFELDCEQLCHAARRATGLDDFGDPPVDLPLSLLVLSLKREANLHPLGKLLIKIHLHGLLTARLKLAAQYQLQDRPGARTSIVRPIFIIGMPRSGSTFLHELLALDPALRAPRVWEVMCPAEAVRPDRGWHDSRVWQAAWCLWWFRRLAPMADTVYPMRARTPHECVAIQSHTFLSEEFVSTCNIPTYETFLRSTNLRPAYEWQKRFMEYLQQNRPATRWLLKSPDHVRGLDALFSVFPDALIIQTHRNPIDSLRSSMELTQVLRRLYGRSPDRGQLAEREAQNLAWSVGRIVQFRDQHPELARRFLDLNYSDLVSDPVAAVRRIYREFELPVLDTTLLAIRKLARRRSAYKWRRTVSKLDEVGLRASGQVQLFAEYCRRFGIRSGAADAH
ncbi:MAG TPA: sulfotransferase [Verrucomicrobiae bacterium]|nr:sulfotransferase [Verrucomicrobiae bacterium]